MSKISQPSSDSKISQESDRSSITDSSASGSADYIEKGFYDREVRLLINEGGSFIGTENGDNLLLEIKKKDTVQVTSTISGDNSL